MISKREAILGGFGLALAGKTAVADTMLKIPLTVDVKGHPLVSLHINGQGPFIFRVDAGARHSTIGTRLANRLKLQLIGDALDPYEGLANGKAMRVYRVNAARVETEGGPVFKNLIFLRGVDIDGVDGIIGNALFSSQPCILDNDAGEIRYYDKQTLPLEGFSAIPARVMRSGIRSMAVIVEAKLAGEVMRCGISTSSNTEVFVSSTYVKAQGLWDKYPDFVLEDNGANGPIRRIAPSSHFQIGPFHFATVELTLCDPTQAQAEPNGEFDAILGMGALSRFAIAFDGKGGVWFKPNAWAIPKAG